ncbi:hypothetical protein AAE02nite_02540 [Adhaeribacter aerolatus]|uniref:Guanylate cyclase domain-containing protein n=1 Tax=Adhaeribacter aerolatus TaxID=670289 RepID=A0A512ASB3_9BACT|nr:DUF2652 domain-containing protein [Adhaeribacter aerolatus]GEO02590.1 hypothetical protein AAE02nite_02540 [Adhaeribacter aerolatus]
MGILRNQKKNLAPQVPAANGANDTQPALIFIPDISGFTKFVNETGLETSRNLIADLLEIIIEANILDMELAEIQGDAVLFYRLGPPPPVQEVINQCKQIFIDFQNYLKIVERDQGTEVGASLSDSRLTLKVVVHYGCLSVTQIREHIKLMGKNVIIAHRLLKNNIAGDEYVLLSEDYLRTQPEPEIKANFSWSRLHKGSTFYEHLGEIKYRYAFLTPLRLLVTTNRPMQSKSKFAHVFATDIIIKAPARYVLRIISNFRLKPAWVAGMSRVHFDTTKANRMGISYKCDLNRGQIDVQTVQSFIGEKQIEYVEKIANFRIFPNAFLFYYLTTVEEDKTYLQLKFHYSSSVVGSYIYSFFIRRRMKIFLGKSIRQLKALCEQMYQAHPR